MNAGYNSVAYFPCISVSLDTDEAPSKMYIIRVGKAVNT